MTETIFFAGTGNMGAAILRGLLKAGTEAKSIYFYDPSDKAAQEILAFGCNRVNSFAEGIAKASIAFLCVKPQIFKQVKDSWSNAIANEKSKTTFISIMAGVTRKALVDVLGENNQVLRVMPNLPLTVAKGAVALATDCVSEQTLKTAEEIFGTVGTTCRVQESLMDAVTGLSGSAPAYVFEFIEALTRGGVKSGLTRDVSLKLALQTIEGSVALVKHTGKSPSDLCAMVCSPAGTTIAGIDALEQGAFRGSVIKAIVAGTERSKALGK